MEIYRGFHIAHDPPPIPLRHWDWQWWHEDYDGAPEETGGPPADNRSGASNSLADARRDIDAFLLDQE